MMYQLTGFDSNTQKTSHSKANPYYLYFTVFGNFHISLQRCYTSARRTFLFWAF